jgi:DNA polymerase-3 subunit beta
MKFKTIAKEFQQALGVVEGIIPARTPLPAATHVLIEFKGGMLTLTGSDLNNQVQYSFPAEGEEGVALVPARKLLGFAKTLQGRELEAESTPDKGLAFTTENIELALPGLPPEDFPRVPSPAGATFRVDQGTLCRALRMTVFAAAVEEDRHVLRGCYLHFSEGLGRVVATDSRRLAVVEFTPTVEPSDPNAQFIIPTAVAKLLLAHLTGESEVTCTIGEKQVSFECPTSNNGRYRLIFSKLEGNYPNYSRFIQPLQRENTIGREALLQALKRASAAVEEKDGTVDLQFEGSRLVIKSQTTCKFHEALEMDYKGNSFTTVFAPRYISKALEESPDDEVKFDLQGPQSPLVMRGHNFMYLAMPRRMN